MSANQARLQVESMEDRVTPAHYANLGEGVSGVARAEPGGQAALAHTTQAAAGTDFGQVVAFTARNPHEFPG